MCKRWLDNFPNFFADMGPCPDGLTLDRINFDGNYEPGNCRWATSKQQSRNRSGVIRVVYQGQECTLPDLAEKLKIDLKQLRHFYRTRKLSLAEAISRCGPPKQRRHP